MKARCAKCKIWMRAKSSLKVSELELGFELDSVVKDPDGEFIAIEEATSPQGLLNYWLN